MLWARLRCQPGVGQVQARADEEERCGYGGPQDRDRGAARRQILAAVFPDPGSHGRRIAGGHKVWVVGREMEQDPRHDEGAVAN
jgi:hypothetical protein